MLGITIDDNNNIYLADASNNRIRKINNVGIITTIAGNGSAGAAGDGTQAINANLNQPGGAILDRVGNLYIADYNNHRIRKVSQSGIISTFAGTGASGFSGDGGLATSAQLNNPFMVALDKTGNLYVSDRSNNKIRKVTCIQPTVIASSISSSLCAGQSATLTASGASIYNWLLAGAGHTIVVSPPSSTTYSVIGTNSVTGCSSSATFAIVVETCTGIKSLNNFSGDLNIFPNPSNGKLTIVSNEKNIISISTISGVKICQISLTKENGYKAEVDITVKGIYIIECGTLRKKIIIH